MSDNLLEERLRRALDARARQITPERLQPAAPPTAAAPVRRWPWRLSWRSTLVAAAVTAVAVLAIWRPLVRTDHAPTLPPVGPVQPSFGPPIDRPPPTGSAPPSQIPASAQPGVAGSPSGSGRPGPPVTSGNPGVSGTPGASGTPGGRPSKVTGTPGGPGLTPSPSSRPGAPAATESPATHGSSLAT